MVSATSKGMSDASLRDGEWVWYDMSGDWRVVVSQNSCAKEGVFNVTLGTGLYENETLFGVVVLDDSKVVAETVHGYADAMARAAELMRDAEELIAGQEERTLNE